MNVEGNVNINLSYYSYAFISIQYLTDMFFLKSSMAIILIKLDYYSGTTNPDSDGRSIFCLIFFPGSVIPFPHNQFCCFPLIIT